MSVHDRIRRGVSTTKLSRMLKRNPVDEQDEKEQTALHVAASEGRIDSVRLLLKKGASLNITDYNGWTPLHAAAATGHLKICQLLIEQPTCDVRAVNTENSSVLHYLVRKPVHPDKSSLYRAVMESLVRANINVNVQNKQGEAPLHSACMGANVEAVRFLLSNNADPNLQTSFQQTPLHYAIRSHDLEIVRLLCEYDADPNMSTDGGTPLDVASEYGQMDILELLTKHQIRLREKRAKEAKAKASTSASGVSATSGAPGSHSPVVPRSSEQMNLSQPAEDSSCSETISGVAKGDSSDERTDADLSPKLPKAPIQFVPMYKDGALRKGYLHMLRRRKWQHYYFVLKERTLYYYRDAKDFDPLGEFDITTTKIKNHREAVYNKEHCFELLVPDKKHLLHADSDKTKQEWVAILQALSQSVVGGASAGGRRIGVSASTLSLPSAASASSSAASSSAAAGPSTASATARRRLLGPSEKKFFPMVSSPDLRHGQNLPAQFAHGLPTRPTQTRVARVKSGDYTNISRIIASPKKRNRAQQRRQEFADTQENLRKLIDSLQDSYDEPEAKLAKALLEPNFAAVAALCDIAGVDEDEDDFSKSLIAFFDAHNKITPLLKWATTREICFTTSQATLFRQMSMATRLMSAYLFSKPGLLFLREMVGPLVQSVCAVKHSLEIDPSKAAGRDVDVKRNLELLAGFAQKFLDRLFKSVEEMPVELREVFAHLQEETSYHWPEMRHIVVGGFLFLRYLCPCIVSPYRYGLLKDDRIDHRSQRALILISKPLQSLANDVELGEKEANMTDWNPFIRQNRSRLLSFYAEVTDPTRIAAAAKKNSVRFEVPESIKSQALLSILKYINSKQDKIYELMTRNSPRVISS